MGLTWLFIKNFVLGLFYATPLLISLIVVIALIGLRIGRREGWSRIDAFYYAMITATTVGYGDFRPQQTLSKLQAILIAFVGLLLTGLVVSIGVQAATVAFKGVYV